MFDPNSAEAEQRLDRLEREFRRRKCDSAILFRNRDGGAGGQTPAVGTRLPRGEFAVDDPAAAVETSLLELMAERLDLLERKSVRLEAELRRWARRDLACRRVILGVSLVAALLIAAGVPFAVGYVTIEEAPRPRLRADRLAPPPRAALAQTRTPPQ